MSLSRLLGPRQDVAIHLTETHASRTPAELSIASARSVLLLDYILPLCIVRLRLITYEANQLYSRIKLRLVVTERLQRKHDQTMVIFFDWHFYFQHFAIHQSVYKGLAN